MNGIFVPSVKRMKTCLLLLLIFLCVECAGTKRSIKPIATVDNISLNSDSAQTVVNGSEQTTGQGSIEKSSIFNIDFLENFPVSMVDTFFQFGRVHKPQMTFEIFDSLTYGLYTVDLINVRRLLGLPPVDIRDASILLKVDSTGFRILASEHVKEDYVLNNFKYNSTFEEYYRIIGLASSVRKGTPKKGFYLFSDRTYQPKRILNYRTADDRFMDGHSMEIYSLDSRVNVPSCFQGYKGSKVYVYTGAYHEQVDISEITGAGTDTARVILRTPYVIADSLNRPLCEGDISNYGGYYAVGKKSVDFGADTIDLTHGNSAQLGKLYLPDGVTVTDPMKLIKSDKHVGVWQIDVETNTADFLYGEQGQLEFDQGEIPINQHDAQAGTTGNSLSLFINQNLWDCALGVVLNIPGPSLPPDSVIHRIRVVDASGNDVQSIATGSFFQRQDGLFELCAGLTFPLELNQPAIYIYNAQNKVCLQGGANISGIIPYQFHGVPAELEEDVKVVYSRDAKKVWVSSPHDGIVSWSTGETTDSILVYDGMIDVIVKQGTRQLYGERVSLEDIKEIVR